jgi:hypothetical protein
MYAVRSHVLIAEDECACGSTLKRLLMLLSGLLAILERDRTL